MAESSQVLCHVCGLRPAGSREHLPGVAAANDGPVDVFFPQPTDGSTGEGMRSERRRYADGFVVRTLCSKCNCRTGGNYGTAYKSFVRQFSESGLLSAGLQRNWINLTGIQPLRVLKQMATIFLASQTYLSHDHWREIREFVLRRDRKLPNGALRFYLYRNGSSIGRIVALQGVTSIWKGTKPPPLVFSEVSWPPVGVVFATDPHPLVEKMKDITEWGQYRFKDRDSFGFSVPELAVESHWPLSSGSPAEAEAWVDRLGLVYLVHAEPESDSPHQISALVRRPPPP